MARTATITILILFTSLFTSAQDKIKTKDIIGSWYCCNKNNIYYNSDTLVMYSSPVVYECCDEVVWWMKSGIFRKYDNSCKDKFKKPDNSKNYGAKFSIVKTRHKTILIVLDGKLIREKFAMLSIQNIELTKPSGSNYKKLTLIRLPLY